jgi:hypothetical protein
VKSGSSTSSGSAVDAAGSFRLTRVDMSSIVLAFLLSSALAATWLVPALHGVDDVVRHWLAVATASSLGQMLIRWAWRKVSPRVKRALRAWLEIDQGKKDAANAGLREVSQLPVGNPSSGKDSTAVDVPADVNASHG